MARLFTAASSEIAAYTTAAPLTAVPLTMAGLVRLTAVGTATRILCEIRDKDNATSQRQGWRVEMNGSEQVVARASSSTATASAAYTASTLAANTWTHVGAVFGANNSRFAYYNGLASTENTTGMIPGSVDCVLLGAGLVSTSTVNLPWDGDMAEWAIWNVALTDAEMAMLAAGYSPLMVRPDALVAYWPVVGKNSPETDIVGAYDLTLTGTSASEHPRIIRPSAKILTLPSGGTSYTLAVDKGTLTLTGKSVTFNASLGVTKADLTATGQSVGFGATIAVGNGTLTLTGQDVGLTVSGSYTLPVDKGTLALVGQDVTLTAQTDYTLAVGAATLSLAGKDVALLLGGQTVNPPVGGGRPGRTYAYPSEPSRKRRKAPEKPQETTSAPEQTTKTYEVAGRLGAITEVPDNVVQLPVPAVTQVVTGSSIEPVQKSLEEVVQEAVQKAMAQYQAVQDGEKILKQLEKEEAELSLRELESLLLLAMVD